MKWNEYGVTMTVHPGAFAVVFGLQANDCEQELRGMLEQLKGEALEADLEFMNKRIFS